MNDSVDKIDASINVMVIDSNPDESSLTARIVQQAKLGTTVIIPADSIESALESVRHLKVDCIILDLLLNKSHTEDPLENLRKITQRQFQIDAPVIVVTGDKDEKLGVDAVRLGAQDFIVKGRLSSDNIGKMIGYAIERYKKLKSARIDSLTDPCTGLFNRRGFISNLQQLIYEKERNRSSLVVAIVDLDDFKTINDQFGHAVGDQVLNYVGGCLSQNLRRTDCVARLGGDEFAVYLSNIDKEQDVLRILGDKLGAIRTPMTYQLDDQSIQATAGASIGWIWWEKGLTAEDTIRLADEFMYAVKRSGKNKVEGGRKNQP